jgi:ketosteroid isomerase-like protein
MDQERLLQVERDLRLQRDLEDIRRAKYEYAMACDDGYDAARIAELFTDDGVWDGGRYGRHVGRKAIYDFFSGVSSHYRFSAHWMLNPIIDVHGDEATAHWYLFMAATRADKQQAVWNSARYHDTLRRHSNVWRFATMQVRHDFTTSFERGWAREPFIS